MRDFTLEAYLSLLRKLEGHGSEFNTFSEFMQSGINKSIILRQDVDNLPGNSLDFARIQADAGLKGTYYFRMVTGKIDEKVIRKVNDLDHEIGYAWRSI
jgi:hypothetical protein